MSLIRHKKFHNVKKSLLNSMSGMDRKMKDIGEKLHKKSLITAGSGSLCDLSSLRKQRWILGIWTYICKPWEVI